MAEILESRSGDLRELIVAETGSTGFLTDFVQAAGSIGMFRSNAAISEHSFPWVESGLPAGQAAGMAGSAIVREPIRSEEHTSELQSLMRISYAVFCLKNTNHTQTLIQIQRSNS